jgi:FkbH-like protein
LESEIQNLVGSGALECLTVEVRDRFGDYGLVGVMLFKSDPDTLWVDTFLQSCRVLGRRVEHRMLARLGEIALERDCSTVTIPYRQTPRNKPAIDFLNSLGAKRRQPCAEGYVFEIPAGLAAALTHYMES